MWAKKFLPSLNCLASWTALSGDCGLREINRRGLRCCRYRIAGQVRRYEELRQRLQELLAGKIAVIDELEERPTRPLAKVSCDIATSPQARRYFNLSYANCFDFKSKQKRLFHNCQP